MEKKRAFVFTPPALSRWNFQRKQCLCKQGFKCVSYSPDVLLPRFLHTSKSRFFEVQLPAGARLILPLSSEGRWERKMQLLLGRTTSPRGPSRRREGGNGRWTRRVKRGAEERRDRGRAAY